MKAIYGTRGGIATGEGYRVRNNNDEAITGLYAIDNASRDSFTWQ